MEAIKIIEVNEDGSEVATLVNVVVVNTPEELEAIFASVLTSKAYADALAFDIRERC